MNEAEARNKPISGDYEVMLIGRERVERGGMVVHTPRDLEEEDAHLRLLAADIIVVGSDCYPAVAERLPVYARYRNSVVSRRRRSPPTVKSGWRYCMEKKTRNSPVNTPGIRCRWRASTTTGLTKSRGV